MDQVYFGSAGYQTNCLYGEAFQFTAAVSGTTATFDTVTASVFGVEPGDVILIANSSNSLVIPLGANQVVDTKGELKFSVYVVTSVTADVTFQAMLFRPENPLS